MQKTLLFMLILICSVSQNLIAQHNSISTKNEDSRYNLGWEKLKEIDGHAGEAVIESLKDISPDLGQYIIEYVFGDVYTRTAINDKEREIAVVAAMTALGNAAPQLKVHMHAALNVGCSPTEVIQVVVQTAPYAGIPASLNALELFKEVLKERNIQFSGVAQTSQPHQEIIKNGTEKLHQLIPDQKQQLDQHLGTIAPEMVDYILYTYGNLFIEEVLPAEYRQLATIGALAAIGTARPQLKLHLNGALNIGIKPEKLKEVMITMSVYTGFPAALNGMFTLKQVLQEREANDTSASR